MKTVRITDKIYEELSRMRDYHGEPIWCVIDRVLNIAKNKSTKKEQKKSNATETSSGLWDIWLQAYRERYGVDYPSNAKNHSLLKTLREKIGLDQAKKVIPFYLKSLDPWIVSRQHPLEVLVKDAESWVAREANNLLLISRSKVTAYDSAVSWAELADKIKKEIEEEQ